MSTLLHWALLVLVWQNKLTKLDYALLFFSSHCLLRLLCWPVFSYFLTWYFEPWTILPQAFFQFFHLLAFFKAMCLSDWFSYYPFARPSLCAFIHNGSWPLRPFSAFLFMLFYLYPISADISSDHSCFKSGLLCIWAFIEITAWAIHWLLCIVTVLLLLYWIIQILYYYLTCNIFSFFKTCPQHLDRL